MSILDHSNAELKPPASLGGLTCPRFLLGENLLQNQST